MKEFFLERKMIFESVETGMRKNLTIKIGYPYWDVNKGYALCPRIYEGLFEHVADAVGVDLIHALYLATDIDSMLESQTKYRFYWSNGEPYFD